MSNKKPASKEPTLNPDMSEEILGLLKSQVGEGIELDKEALEALNQFAGKEFKEIYMRIAGEKAKEGLEQKQDENMEADSTHGKN